MTVPVSDAKILLIVRAVPPSKALGLDGFHAIFYQQYWHILGPSVIALVREFFQDIL